MKVFANYLPQFHVIPENDEFWGKDFTDWVSCKNAKSLYKGHVQPKKPLNDNYYSLTDINSIKWQASLAKEYGINGFAIYHYWFHDGLNLLTKPVELLRDNKNIDIEYFFIWDNNSWKKTWSALTGSASWIDEQVKETKVLAELIYGDEHEWKAHFDYLLPFFKDDRYLKLNNKPVFALFNTYGEYETLKKIERYWNGLCKKNGFEGIIMVSRADYKQKQFTYSFVYTPFAATNWHEYICMKIKQIIEKNKVKKYRYDDMWKRILSQAKKYDSNVFLSGFVDFDDTPRRGTNGKVVIGSTPKKFEKYLGELISIAKKNKTEIVLVTAWNEWGEGAYLEPDVDNGYAYLEALKRAIDSVRD